MAPSDKAEIDRQFTEIYRTHLRDVYSYSYYRVGNHHDAEDLTEQTFLQAYRHLERALRESNGRPLRPWLIRIAHNLAANLYRDRSRRPETAIDDTTVLSTTHTTEDLAEGREELRHILEGVDDLPGERREALIMRFALGMDNREIARALGKTDGATKVLIHRAIKQLEERVAERRGRRRRERELPDFEALLRQALSPIEPPAQLAERLESTLFELTELAQDELEAWELGAMRDPRNWVRPVAATVVGGAAGSALVALRIRRTHRRRRSSSSDVLDLAARTVRDAAREAQRVFDRRGG